MERSDKMSIGGPKAPKDPTKKRPHFYIVYEKEMEAYGAPGGAGRMPVLLDQNRFSGFAKSIGKITDEELLAELDTPEGFKKAVHSIGVSVACDRPGQEAEFILQMYGNRDYFKSGTFFRKSIKADGSENLIELSEVTWSDDDKVPGQFTVEFKEAGALASVSMCIYLNDGYTAPEFEPDEPVDYESADYRAMIAKSFTTLGNNARLKKAIEKAKSGEDVTVAYIGGSITEGAGAAPAHSSCYARRSYEAFCKRFSVKDNVHYTKAGVGGTPSELGMIRFERDILEGKEAPDIVIIEFAVNDEGDETKGDCYESLIRKVLALPNKPAVILLFAVFEFDWNLQERLMPIGRRYNLPMVSVKDAVVEQFYLPAKKGRVISKNRFFYDIYHPTNAGHRIMADCLDYLFEKADESEAGEDIVLSEIEPYMNPEFETVRLMDRKDLYEFAEIDCGSFTETDREIHFVEMDFDTKHTGVLPYNWMCTEGTGDKPFVIRIKSPYLLVISKDSGDPKFGAAEIYVDGELAVTADPRVTGWNHSNAQIAYRGKEDTWHTVEIHCPKGESRRFTIQGFGYKG